MNSYWFTYKTDKWPIENLRDLVDRVQDGSIAVTEWWRIAASKSARIGDRAYLFKQGAGGRGIFGTGLIIDGPKMRGDTDGEDGERFRVCIEFDKLVDPTIEFLIAFEDIGDFVPAQLINTQSSGVRVPDDVARWIEARLSEKSWATNLKFDALLCDDSEFDPGTVVDHRERALRAIRVRRGQAVFRNALLLEYDSRCTVTGCAIEDVLEAAHISPYLGRLSNDLCNGLLLRADIHTLFDCLLISIDPRTRAVQVSEKLRSSSYKSIESKKLRSPKNEAKGPSKKALELHYASFRKQNS